MGKFANPTEGQGTRLGPAQIYFQFAWFLLTREQITALDQTTGEAL